VSGDLTLKSADDSNRLIAHGHRLLRQGQRREAFEVGLRAEKRILASAALDDSLGTLFTHLEEPLRALAHHRRAVERAPSCMDFRYNLAMTQRMLGEFDAAEVNLDAVLLARPRDGEAHYARSGLRTQTPRRNHVDELQQILVQLDGKRASLAVAFSLAKELEDLGEYARAFDHLHKACDAYRASLRYDVADDIAVLDALRTTHIASILGKLQTNCPSRECIFIVGLPRSGTTLVERIVGSHSQVFAAGETDAFQRTCVAAVGQLKKEVKKLEFVERSLELDFERLAQAFIQATRPRTGHTPQFTDKTPHNYLYAGLIRAALPNARFIALDRHPMDVCYAMYKTLFASSYPFSYDLSDLARYYVAWQKLMQHWQDLIGDAWLTVSYEELVSAQEATSRRILEHCGLSWEHRCLDFHSPTAAVSTASAVQVRKPLYTDAVGRWRHYAKQLESLARDFEINGLSVR